MYDVFKTAHAYYYIVVWRYLLIFYGQFIIGNYVKVYLSILFTSFISHGYLAEGFMKSAIIPLTNNKTRDTNDKNKYRPIALVTARS